MKILLLEDDHNYNESILEYLELKGYDVDSYMDGEEALDAIMKRHYYLLILDIKVPGIHGHDLIKMLRESGIETPILIMTSLVDIDNIAIGYELGCNDYLKKPFDLKELELRMQTLVKQCYDTGKDMSCQINGSYVFDFTSGELTKDKNPISLSPKEKELVRFLIERKNSWCDMEMLREHVWEGKEITYADIRMCIRKIRLKTDSEFITSQRGEGYKIICL